MALEVEPQERESLADIFYQEVLDRPLLDSAKRKEIDRYFREIVTNIAADDRVESTEQAEEILTDAFGRVKKKVALIWSHKIMTEDYGEKAIEEAIKAKSVSSLSESSSFPSVDPSSEDAPTESKDESSKSQNSSAALPSVEDRIREALLPVPHKDRDRIANSARRYDNDRLDGISDAEILTVWDAMQASHEAVRLSKHSWVDGGLERIGEAA